MLATLMQWAPERKRRAMTVGLFPLTRREL